MKNVVVIGKAKHTQSLLAMRTKLGQDINLNILDGKVIQLGTSLLIHPTQLSTSLGEINPIAIGIIPHIKVKLNILAGCEESE